MYNPEFTPDETSTGVSWPMFALGALVGAGVCMVVAPTTGREVRSFLADRGRELIHKLDEGIRKAEQVGREYQGSYSEKDAF